MTEIPYKPRDESITVGDGRDGKKHVRITLRSGQCVEGEGHNLDELLEELRDELGKIVRGDE